jgi:hypothetical protein
MMPSGLITKKLFDISFPLTKIKFNKNLHKINNFMSAGLLISRGTISRDYLRRNHHFLAQGYSCHYSSYFRQKFRSRPVSTQQDPEFAFSTATFSNLHLNRPTARQHFFPKKRG